MVGVPSIKRQFRQTIKLTRPDKWTVAVEFKRDAVGRLVSDRAFCHPSGYSVSVGLGQVLRPPSAN
jgi:hypothetical protein